MARRNINRPPKLAPFIDAHAPAAAFQKPLVHDWLSPVLDSMLARAGINEASLWRIWATILPKELATLCTPLRINTVAGQKVLIIYAPRHSVVIVQHSLAQIKAAINAHFQESIINEVRVQSTPPKIKGAPVP